MTQPASSINVTVIVYLSLKYPWYHTDHHRTRRSANATGSEAVCSCDPHDS